jgi:hypothetical protein
MKGSDPKFRKERSRGRIHKATKFRFMLLCQLLYENTDGGVVNGAYIRG